ncbi:glutamate mutase L, partial [Chloroflexota bacterium]
HCSRQGKALGAGHSRYRCQPLPVLKPEAPEFYVDRDYIFYAMGLLSEVFPDKALRLLKRSLHNV